jgi:hypothetical protein
MNESGASEITVVLLGLAFALAASFISSAEDAHQAHPRTAFPSTLEDY